MEGGPRGHGQVRGAPVRRAAPVMMVVAALAGCDRAPGGGGPDAKPPMTDGQAIEAAWARWTSCAAAADGEGAWACLSKASQGERSALLRAEAARLRGLSGPAAESEARLWGVPAAELPRMDASRLAILSLAQQFRTADRPPAPPSGPPEIHGDAAVLKLGEGDSRDAVGFVREDGAWRIDDAASRRANVR